MGEGITALFIMKKNTAILFVACIAMLFTACKKDKSTQMSTNELVGSWEVVEGYYNTVAEHKTAPVWVRQEEYEGMVLRFDANGSGSWDGDDIKWTVNDSMTKLSVIYDDEVIYDYEIKLSNNGKQLDMEGYYFKLKTMKL